MSTPAVDLPAARACGRPRDEARQLAILDAAFALLGEVGYDRVTIEAVALRAGASKATVYRRWPGKAALVVDALRSRTPDHSWPDTGSLRSDLLAGLQRMTEFMTSREGRVALGLTWAMQQDETLGTAMRQCMLADKGSECTLLLERAVRRGELDEIGPAAALVPMTLFGLLHARVVVAGLLPDDAFVATVVDRVLLPMLRSSDPPPPPTSDTPTSDTPTSDTPESAVPQPRTTPTSLELR